MFYKQNIKTQINNVNIVNEIHVFYKKYSLFNFLFDIYCPEFIIINKLLQRFDTK